MDEVSGALVGIVLVLCAVFLPTLFLDGLSGAFYHQFAVTISTATVISLLVSLTLSPALAAILLRHDHVEPTGGGVRRLVRAAGDGFNRAFHRMSEGYAALTAKLISCRAHAVAYAGLISATVGCSG
jgi:multidrug efflux pump subunit AcrB